MSAELRSGFISEIFPGFNPCNKEDAEIYTLLESWIEASHRYIDKFKLIPDNPWWYNERANVSILAGAAWLLDWIAFEEYSCRKQTDGTENSEGIEPTLTRYGRNDLYIGSPSQSFIFEAKHVWVSMNPKSDYIQKGRNAALKDIRLVKAKNDDRCFAATFVIPFIPSASCSKPGDLKGSFLKEKVDNFLDRFKRTVKANNPEINTFYAYLFQIEPGRNEYRRYQVKNNYYPGVILILDECYANSDGKK